MYQTSMFMYISFYPNTEHLIPGSIRENWVTAKLLFEYDTTQDSVVLAQPNISVRLINMASSIL